MRNVELWRASKFVYRGPRLGPSPDAAEVSVRSRLAVHCMAPYYDQAIRDHASGRLLDFGCGKVPLYLCYGKLVSGVTCIDWPGSLHGSFHVDVAADLNRSLPMVDRSFDTVLATDVLEHLSRPLTFWSEVSRVLRPGGKLILGIPFLYWLHEAPHDYMRHTEFSLATHCHEAGLSLVSLHAFGGPVSVVLDIVGKNIQRPRLASGFQRLAVSFYQSRLGSALDTRTRSLFPLGYCLVAMKPR